MRISLRDKRQITLPAELCEALGISPGDVLDARVEDDKLVITPSRKAVLDALKELSRALKEAGISEEELLEGGRQVRKELTQETWPHLFPAVEKRDQGTRVFLDTNVLFSAIHSRSGVPFRILTAAAEGLFEPVISGLVVDELVRNLHQKAPASLSLLEGLLSGAAFEVTSVPFDSEITRWRDAGFGTDAPIIAAAMLNEIDYLCTGDRGIHARSGLCLEAGLKLIRPTDLLALLPDSRAKAL